MALLHPYYLRNKLISAFTKKCPICKCLFKDTLDRLIVCINCNRNSKINEILK